MNYLIKVTNIYRVPTVADALKLREELSHIECGSLMSFSYTTKYIKQRSEIVDEYQLCKATIEFTPEKEPELKVEATYNV